MSEHLFKFDEISGPKWYDSKDASNYLEPVNNSFSTMSVTGVSGRAMSCLATHYFGPSAYYYASGILNWTPNANFKISFYLKNRNDGIPNDSFRGILSLGDINGSNILHIVTGYGMSTGHKQLIFRNFGGIDAATGEVLTFGSWDLIEFYFNGVGNPVTVYVNSIPQALTGTIIPTSVFVPSSNIINVGGYHTAITSWDIINGDIDELSFSDLSASSQIRSTIVSQNNGDTIPFWFISESGFEDSSQINFTIESANATSVNYDVSFQKNGFIKNAEIPENENSEYRHDAFSTVDIIVKDYSGVKDLSVRTQKEIYEYEIPNEVYNTPKFSWNNTPFNETSSDTALGIDASILLGTDNKKLFLYDLNAEKADPSEVFSNKKGVAMPLEFGTYRFWLNSGTSYDIAEGVDLYWNPTYRILTNLILNGGPSVDDVVSWRYSTRITGETDQISSNNTTSEVHKILVSNRYGEVYLSEYDTIAKYSINKYSNSYPICKMSEIANQNLDLMSYCNSSIIVSTEAYSGKVIIRNIEDFSIISEYIGFDSPFKAIRSAYHNSYFIAGTNKIWKLTDAGVKKTIYEIKDFKITDIDCSETGQICILLSGTSSDIARVLDKDLYKFVINQEYPEKLRFCKYCGKGIFYILGEVINGDDYDKINIIVDINKKTINYYSYVAEVSTTTTTTTLPEPTNKFELFYPDGENIISKDSIQVIKWQSTGSIGDEVSLELYKGGRLFDTIAPTAKNTGNYSWQVSNAYQDGTDYKIKGTWLSASNNSSNSDISSNVFSIVSDVTVSTTTEGKNKSLYKAIGIDYSEYNNAIFIALENGLISVFDLSLYENVGVYETNIFNANFSGKIISMAIHESRIGIAGQNSKARIFVGSSPYLNDKWDSGPIDSDLNYMYYGGGDNLVAGNTYYMNVQTYTDKYGWSEVQTKAFSMPI